MWSYNYKRCYVGWSILRIYTEIATLILNLHLREPIIIGAAENWILENQNSPRLSKMSTCIYCMRCMYAESICILKWAHKTSLTPSLFIEPPVPRQESKRSCIGVLGLPLFLRFFDQILELWNNGIFLFSFYYWGLPDEWFMLLLLVIGATIFV